MGNITLDQIQHFLVNFASIITAGGIVCAFALKIGKQILNRQLEPFNKRIDDMDKAREEQHEETKREIKIIRDELHKNSLNTMKNTICNDNIPITERLEVGKEYIEHGGNGAVKIYVHELETRYEQELKKNKEN